LDVIFQFMVNLHGTNLIYHNNSYYSVSFVFITLAWTFFTILSNALLRSGSNIYRRSLPVRNIGRSGTVNGRGRWTAWNVHTLQYKRSAKSCSRTHFKNDRNTVWTDFLIAENLTYWCLNDLSLIRLSSVEKGALQVCPRYFYSLFVTMLPTMLPIAFIPRQTSQFCPVNGSSRLFSLLQKIMFRNKN